MLALRALVNVAQQFFSADKIMHCGLMMQPRRIRAWTLISQPGAWRRYRVYSVHP